MRQTLLGLATVLGTTVAATAADGRQIAGDPRPDLRAERRERALTDREVADLTRFLIGKSEAAAVARLGRPARTRSAGDSARLIYRFGRSRLTIYVRSGRVVDVGGDERQTGVREDDFVGLVGP